MDPAILNPDLAYEDVPTGFELRVQGFIAFSCRLRNHHFFKFGV